MLHAQDRPIFQGTKEKVPNTNTGTLFLAFSCSPVNLGGGMKIF